MGKAKTKKAKTQPEEISIDDLTPEERAFAEKAVGVFNTQWHGLHKRLQDEVWPKMGLPGATKQAFVNLTLPIFREAVESWNKAVEEMTQGYTGKLIFAEKSLMAEKIKETWAKENDTIGRQIKRYL